MPHNLFIQRDEARMRALQAQANLLLPEGHPPLLTGSLYPKAVLAVLILDGDTITPLPMVWGFVGWTASVIYNARAETAREKPMFRRALRENPCVIPTSGFIDRRREAGKPKMQAYLFTQAASPVLYLAGCWKTFAPKDGPVRERFTLLSTNSNASLADGFDDRMPVLLRKNECEAWLQGENLDTVLTRVPFALRKRPWPGVRSGSDGKSRTP